MKLIFSIYFLLSCLIVSSQSVPEGYLLQYQQSFSGGKALSDFEISYPDKWGVFKAGSNFYLQCAALDSSPQRPGNIGIIDNRIFGDFILETDVLPLKDSLGFAEICLFLGYMGPDKYYYVQLANTSDSATNGIFLVKNGYNTRITGEEERIFSWKEGKWTKVRLVRDIIRRTISVYVDNMTTPFMVAKDWELVMGSVGLGSYRNSSRFDNIKIWSPTVLTEEELERMK